MTRSTGFADHFSGVARGYAAYRPSYPEALFDALAEWAPDRALAWDCAAGNGQASVSLAERFAQVIATDASAGQIANAERHPRVEYRVAPAEQCGIAERSVSLVTVAQALHWFNVQQFYDEVRRVLVPDGVVAVWCYGLMRAPSSHDIEALLDDFSERRMLGWWPPERVHIDRQYSDLPFPFEHIETGTFAMEADWTQAQLEGYLRTWSAVSRIMKATGTDPVVALSRELTTAFAGAPTVHLVWPLTVIAGRVNGASGSSGAS